jgi:hypothetical protein
MSDTNAPGFTPSTPSTRDEQTPSPHSPDRHLAENSKENLDRKLDHAIKETFPTSDPVSVTITKGGAIDYDRDGNPVLTPSNTTIRNATREAEALLRAGSRRAVPRSRALILRAYPGHSSASRRVSNPHDPGGYRNRLHPRPSHPQRMVRWECARLRQDRPCLPPIGAWV